MSEAHFIIPRRDQFSTRLKCGRCGADGHALWEQKDCLDAEGPLGHLVSISGNFVQRMPRTQPGLPVIACATCGEAHPG
jgi:hypothetical protein